MPCGDLPNEPKFHMQNYQPITRTSLRGPEGVAFTDEEREQLGLVDLLLDAVEDNTSNSSGCSPICRKNQPIWSATYT
jgi:hypothetical protein